jgi:Glycogen recognition site of AMP-activated protein kinase
MAETDPLEQLIQETRAFVDTRQEPDLVTAVMRQIEHLDAHRVNRSDSWITRLGRNLWTPRSVTFEFRPAYAVLAVASVLMLIAVVPYDWATGDRPLTMTATPDQKVYVQFRLQTSDATEVRLAGSFTQWQPRYQLHENAPGLWTVTLPLAPGVHDYAFIVNGQRWVTDPYAPAIQDGFGGSNSRITLIAGGDSRL